MNVSPAADQPAGYAAYPAVGQPPCNPCTIYQPGRKQNIQKLGLLEPFLSGQEIEPKQEDTRTSLSGSA
eukprot:674304-Pelagomonas_calceolata.AAC.2